MGVPTAHAFDPTEWLNKFELVGGAYILTDRLSLAVLVEDRPDEDIRRARRMIALLTSEDRAALVQHMRRCADQREG
jgi:hypothetical protein